MKQVINRPDELAMRKLLKDNPTNTLGIILRLAWLQGMSREEICNLTWADLCMEKRLIVLKNREIPLDPDTEQCIYRRVALYARTAPYVVISERYNDMLAPGSVSRIVRRALDQAGMQQVRLVDLRHDFIIRQIETHEWAYAIRVSGLSVGTFQATYAKLEIHKKTKAQRLSDGNDEYYMWKILQENKETMEGIALWLRWQMNLQLVEMVDLTWEQVDFEADVLRLEKRTVPLAPTVREILRQELGHRLKDDDPHVLLTPKTRKPVDVARLSKLMRTVLIRGNVEHVTVRYLHGNTQKELDKLQIVKLVKAKGFAVRADVTAELELSPSAAHARLKELTAEGKLVQVLSTYYPAETTVPPERQEETIRRYLLDNGRGCVIELAKLLGLQERQCGRILQKLAEDGKLCRSSKGIYTLREEAARKVAAS